MTTDRIVGKTLRSDPAYRVGYDHGHLDGQAEAAREIQEHERSRAVLLREWAEQRAELLTWKTRAELAEKQVGMLLRMQCDTEAAPGWMERFRDACARGLRMFSFTR